jgi:hypothetical protein
MTKITAPQLAVLMMLARAEAADEWVKATNIRPATRKALMDRGLIDHSLTTGRIWVDRAETTAALWAEHSAADDKRYRHDSRCRACNAGADCATGDRLFDAMNDAYDAAEAFENVFKPFTAQYRTADGEWRTFRSAGRNDMHFASRADAELWVSYRSAFPVTRIMRDGLWVDEATADALCDAYDAHQAEMAAQDADVAAGALTDATVERYGTANPATFDDGCSRWTPQAWERGTVADDGPGTAALRDLLAY